MITLIFIKKSKNADTRSGGTITDKNVLLESSIQHMEDVKKAIGFLTGKLFDAGQNHDHTKVSGIDDFFDSCSKGLIGTAFKAEKWYQSHLSEERHHLNDRCPADVTLVDVMEMVADVTMAGLARTGEVMPDVAELDPSILMLAYRNTIQLLKDNTTVEED